MFTFELLSEADILQGLNAAAIEVKEGYLKFPKPGIITPIYRKYLMVLASFEDEAQLEHPRLIPSVEAPNELKPGFLFLNFFRTMSSLAESAAIQDFSLADLFRPDKERVKRILSGLINFAFFREERLAMFQELRNAINQKIQENADMERQLAELDEVIARKKSEKLDQRNEIELLQSRRDSLRAQLNAIDSEGSEIQESLRCLRREEDAIQSDIERTQREYTRCSKEVGDLKLQLDVSPEEITGDLERAQRENANETQLVTQRRVELQTKKKRDAMLQSAINGIIEILNIVPIIERDKRNLAKLQNEDARLLVEEQEQLEARREDIERLRQQKENKSDEARKRASEVKKLEDAIQKQKQAKKKIQYQHDRERDDLADRMIMVRRQIEDYIERLNDSMKRTSCL